MTKTSLGLYDCMTYCKQQSHNFIRPLQSLAFDCKLYRVTFIARLAYLRLIKVVSKETNVYNSLALIC